MPIRPALRWLYPFDWPQLSASVRFRRAGGRCEACGRQHGAEVAVIGSMWLDPEMGVWRDASGRRAILPRVPRVARLTRTVTACCHVDHDPQNNAGRNLRAWCQSCHLRHDREEHRRRRRVTYRARRALGDLFLGPYRA